MPYADPELVPARATYMVFEAGRLDWGHCLGEVECVWDSDETVWVTPCSRLAMTDAVIAALARRLGPEGVKWMRGWGDGGRQGRMIEAGGLMTNLGALDSHLMEVLHRMVIAIAYTGTPAANGDELPELIAAWERLRAAAQPENPHG